MRPFGNSSLLCALLALIAALPLAAWSQDAPRDLTHLVPDDVGLVVQFDNLSQHVDRFEAGALYSRLQKFPPWRQWLEKQQPQLAAIAEQVGQQLNTQPVDLWKYVFGQEVVLAAWPPLVDPKVVDPKAKAQKAEAGPGLVLVRADTEQRLRDLRESLTRLASGGQTNWRDRTHQELRFRELTVRDGGNEQQFFVAIIGQVGGLTNDERIMKRVLELAAAPAADNAGSVAALDIFRACHDDLPGDAAVRVFLNPRTWDAALAADLKATPAAELAEKQAFVEFWKSVRYGGLSCELGQRLLVQGVMRLDAQRVPAVFREVLGSFGGLLIRCSACRRTRWR